MADREDRIELRLAITWPGGRVENVGAVQGDRIITVKEGAGIVQSAPIPRRTPGPAEPPAR